MRRYADRVSGIDPERVREHLDAVVGAMRASGLWDVPRPDDESFVDMGAFGSRTMSFDQWLRWVFVPQVEQAIAQGGPWPSRSQVAVKAVREADTDPSLGALISPLAAFDALFGR